MWPLATYMRWHRPLCWKGWRSSPFCYHVLTRSLPIPELVEWIKKHGRIQDPLFYLSQRRKSRYVYINIYSQFTEYRDQKKCLQFFVTLKKELDTEEWTWYWKVSLVLKSELDIKKWAWYWRVSLILRDLWVELRWSSAALHWLGLDDVLSLLSSPRWKHRPGSLLQHPWNHETTKWQPGAVRWASAPNPPPLTMDV